MNKEFTQKPWGSFERFTLNQKTTVKILKINKNSKLSLQYHKNRFEFWKILFGFGKVVLGNKIIDAKKGDEFEIPPNTLHRIITADSELEWLEIAFGEFDENDIVRIADDYGRK